ncbi:beta-lactamase-like protein [Pilobolus umbonatus]|nr:beta-lactamase-like protein [Pilobolus umbonatus]
MATVVEVIFLGTGTSSCVPTVSCLTSEKKSCQVCLSSQTPEGIKNCRKNTSFIVRFPSAIHILPKYGIRQLDGVIISHGHADACYGMDDLRGWTLGGAIQSVIHVHLAPETMDTVALTFPFLVDSKMATGGGEVADFRYHVFDPTKSFTIQGLEFTPLAVHHGIYMTTKEPYICYGFHFDGVSYISDTNFIPPKVYDMMKNKTKLFVVDCLRGNLFLMRRE